VTVTLTRLPPADHPYCWAVSFRGLPGDLFRLILTDFKNLVSTTARRWDPARGCWLVKNGAGATVVRLLALYGVPYAQSDGGPFHRASTTRAEAYSALHLLPTAPPALVQSAYRILAKEAHPDRGGTVQDMQILNSAMEVIRKP
jgi:hypothetical protein